MIREAKATDLPAIERMWLALTAEMHAADVRFRLAEDALTRWRNDAPHWLAATSHGVWVVETDAHVVGFADAELWHPPPMYVDEAVAFINHFYVQPEHRRKGLGGGLLDQVQGWAIAQRCSYLQWRTLALNAAGRAFWQAVGGTPFTETWRLPLPDALNQAHPEKPARPLGFH
ncbi:MAG: GNAT family N-acetyltransferase [Bacteroidota bacterium]